jgi:hypothetical protein
MALWSAMAIRLVGIGFLGMANLKPINALALVLLGMWLGFNLAAPLCGMMPTVPLFLRQLTITLVGH